MMGFQVLNLKALFKTECISQVADVLYILLMLGTPAIANPGSNIERRFID